MEDAVMVRLVKKSSFTPDSFESIDPEALKFMESTGEQQILMLTTAKGFPLQIVKAELFDSAVLLKRLSFKHGQ